MTDDEAHSALPYSRAPRTRRGYPPAYPRIYDDREEAMTADRERLDQQRDEARAEDAAMRDREADTR